MAHDYPRPPLAPEPKGVWRRQVSVAPVPESSFVGGFSYRPGQAEWCHVVGDGRLSGCACHSGRLRKHGERRGLQRPRRATATCGRRAVSAVAEVFRCDADHTVTFSAFAPGLPLAAVRMLIDRALERLDPFEDGTLLLGTGRTPG